MPSIRPQLAIHAFYAYAQPSQSSELATSQPSCIALKCSRSVRVLPHSPDQSSPAQLLVRSQFSLAQRPSLTGCLRPFVLSPVRRLASSHTIIVFVKVTSGRKDGRAILRFSPWTRNPSFVLYPFPIFRRVSPPLSSLPLHGMSSQPNLPYLALSK